MTLFVALLVLVKHLAVLLIAIAPFMAGAAALDDTEPTFTRIAVVWIGLGCQVYWCVRGWPL